MDYTNVIIKPLVTEKSTHLQTTRNSYAFQVNADANKPQIKNAVQKLYNVKVLDVRTVNVLGKPRRTKSGFKNKPDWKKAIVKLHADNKIDLF